MRPCANRSANHIASFTSVLRPGTFLTCIPLVSTSSNRSARTAQFRSRRAKRLDVLLDPAAARQTDAGHEAVTVDIEAGATRMKYLHDPSSLRRRRGAHEIEL